MGLISICCRSKANSRTSISVTKSYPRFTLIVSLCLQRVLMNLDLYGRKTSLRTAGSSPGIAAPQSQQIVNPLPLTPLLSMMIRWLGRTAIRMLAHPLTAVTSSASGSVEYRGCWVAEYSSFNCAVSMDVAFRGANPHGRSIGNIFVNALLPQKGQVSGLSSSKPNQPHWLQVRMLFR